MIPDPVLHIRKIKDPQCQGVHVESDETNPSQFCVSSKERLEWLEAVVEVSRFIERRERNRRDD